MSSPEYSVFSDTYVIPVIVHPPVLGNPEAKVYCPTFILPKGLSRIVWNLVTLGPRVAVFAEEGISELLDGPYKLTDSAAVSPTQWTAHLRHDCPQLFDGIAYRINFHFTDDTENLYQHDPTIVVSRDPIEPP